MQIRSIGMVYRNHNDLLLLPFYFTGSNMCVCNHHHGRLLDHRGASYSSDCTSSGVPVSDHWVVVSESNITAIHKRKF